MQAIGGATVYRLGARESALADSSALALVARAADQAGLDRHLVQAVAWTESAFRPDALSHKGAMGLMQLMPATARQYGVADPFDPWQNLQGGAQLLRDLLQRYAGDTRLALAAYNAGAGAVDRAGRAVPPYPETQAYVAKVLERHARLQGHAPALAQTVAPASPEARDTADTAQRLGNATLHTSPGARQPHAPALSSRQIGNAVLLTPARLPRNLPASLDS